MLKVIAAGAIRGVRQATLQRVTPGSVGRLPAATPCPTYPSMLTSRSFVLSARYLVMRHEPVVCPATAANTLAKRAFSVRLGSAATFLRAGSFVRVYYGTLFIASVCAQ